MSKVGEDEVAEYESDPEEEKQFLGRRRREAASDDGESEGEEKLPMGRRAPIHSDESDGQGAAAEYDDEDEDEQDVYEDEEEEEEMYEDEEDDQNERGEVANLGRGNGASEVEAIQRRVVDEEEEITEDNVGEEEGKEGRKENEPFSVPTAGAFYMHDDRFRDTAGGRHRNTFGGRKLWELKDDKKWGHDKFEEMTKQDRRYEQGRRGMKGNYRGRDGKNRLPGKGYPRRSRSRAFSNDENQYQAQKTVRGRGPRKYDTTMRNTSHSRPAQAKQLGRPIEKALHSNSGRNYAPTSSNEVPPARKHSSLSSASPPFYPSGSSNKEMALNQKRDIQVGSTSRGLHSSGGVQQAGTMMRGKNLVDSVPIDKLYINDSVNPDGKFLNNMQVPSGGSSPGNNIQTSHSRGQGRDAAISMPAPYQPVSMHNQVNRVSSATQVHAVQRSSSQGRIQHPVQTPNQPLGQRTGSGSQGSPPNSSSINSYEPAETEATPGSNKSKTALVGKGKSAVQSNGRGFSYGGTQVLGSMGNMGVGHGDQNFPAFLPVMQFGGQSRGGMTVPALGMAFPGYVAQPQLGVGNSEMTWLPVLTGAAGALGATYCPPYIAVDGAYHSHASGQSSAVGSLSKENNTSKPANERQPSSQRPETVSDDSGRQKPRRYSEMDFKQPSTNT